jgi:hypothetical protein
MAQISYNSKITLKNLLLSHLDFKADHGNFDPRISADWFSFLKYFSKVNILKR